MQIFTELHEKTKPKKPLFYDSKNKPDNISQQTNSEKNPNPTATKCS